MRQEAAHLQEVEARSLDKKNHKNFVSKTWREKMQACFAPGSTGEAVHGSQAEDREVGLQNTEVKVRPSSFLSPSIQTHFLKGAVMNWRRGFLRSKLTLSCKERNGKRRW